MVWQTQTELSESNPFSPRSRLGRVERTGRCGKLCCPKVSPASPRLQLMKPHLPESASSNTGFHHLLVFHVNPKRDRSVPAPPPPPPFQKVPETLSWSAGGQTGPRKQTWEIPTGSNPSYGTGGNPPRYRTGLRGREPHPNHRPAMPVRRVCVSVPPPRRPRVGAAPRDAPRSDRLTHPRRGGEQAAAPPSGAAPPPPPLPAEHRRLARWRRDQPTANSTPPPPHLRCHPIGRGGAARQRFLPLLCTAPRRPASRCCRRRTVPNRTEPYRTGPNRTGPNGA